MKQVPDSLLAFQHMFPDDDACAAWLIEMRWPDGFVCPACGHEKGSYDPYLTEGREST